MNESLTTSKEILEQTIKKLEKQPDFPNNYCNTAAKELMKGLTNKQTEKSVRLQFSYLKPGVAHTYVVETLPNGEEFIIDPTYSQYEKKYSKGFIGKKFPNKKLEQNRIEGDEFMKLQNQWFLEGLYG